MDSDGEAQEWVAGWSQRWAAETDASWAISSADDDKVLGQVGLRAISLWEGTAQVSYWVMPAARGNGVAVRAVRAMVRWVFERAGLHRLGLTHSTQNLASCKVAGKAAFRPEGTQLGSMLHADGWHDGHLHGLPRTQWENNSWPDR